MAQPGQNAGGQAATLAQATNRPVVQPPPIPPAPLPPIPMPGAFPPFPPINRLPPLPNTSPGDDWVVDFEDVQAYAKAQIAGDRGTKIREAWLKSEPNWKYRVGKGWRGKRILGIGGQGIVGHWTYEGLDKDQKTMKDIAIKQALRSGPAYIWGDGLETEARWLQKFTRSRSPHIIRMYKQLFEEGGQRTIDLDWGIVQRIYLEFCPGGDLSGWLNKYITHPRNVPEDELWYIFQCLARATLVMHHGSEDLSSPIYMTGGELVHFDLKLANVLIGEEANDLEHKKRPPFKVTDFGLARKVPSGPQDSTYRKQYEYYGTAPFYLPEQVTSYIFHNFGGVRPWTGIFTDFVPNPRYGTHSNIWQIGLIMQTLMRRPPNREPHWPDFVVYQSTQTPRLASGGSTVGSILDAQQDCTDKSLYSKELRALIAECLLLAPANRISPAELVQRTADAVGATQVSMDGILPAQSLTQWAEPVLSAQWYEGQEDPEQVRLAAEFKALKVKVDAQKQPGPIQPANPPPLSRLRVIVQTKPRFGLLGGGHKVFIVNNVSPDTPVVKVKDSLERMGCGIRSTKMNLMHGRTLMLDYQKLGEFPGLDAVRAMNA